MKISDYLTVKEAAELLGINTATLRNWESEKKIKTYRNPANNYRLYKKDEIEQFLKTLKESNG
jgi:excisionase family DNA binding protein